MGGRCQAHQKVLNCASRCDRKKKAMLMLWFSGVAEAVPLLKEHLPVSVPQESCKDVLAAYVKAAEMGPFGRKS